MPQKPNPEIFKDGRGVEITEGMTVCFFEWRRMMFGRVEKRSGKTKARFYIHVLAPWEGQKRIVNGADKVMSAF